jgi:hypothetical protein
MSIRRIMPTPEGRDLGNMIAKLTDNAEDAVRQQFPNHAERCKSCAFRAGTFPNGCPETLMDALKCVVENEPFYCHQEFDAAGKPSNICAGWLIATTEASDDLRKRISPITAPWEYTK